MTLPSTSDSAAAAHIVEQQIQESRALLGAFAAQQMPVLLDISALLVKTLCQGGTVYLCGNGGSACDAMHAAAEFVGRFMCDRRPLPAVALTANTAVITAIANDYAYEEVFARQVQAQLTARDTLVGISTSGKSANVLLALQAARQIGAATVTFTGLGGQERMTAAADLCLCVPSHSTPRIQEVHILAWHLLIDLVEQGCGLHVAGGAPVPFSP